MAYEQDEEITEVVFRVWKTGYRDVIALFPNVDEGRGLVSSYMHVGQHGGADYTGVIQDTRPAKPAEYRDLKMELESIGYRLRVLKRRGSWR